MSDHHHQSGFFSLPITSNVLQAKFIKRRPSQGPGFFQAQQGQEVNHWLYENDKTISGSTRTKDGKSSLFQKVNIHSKKGTDLGFLLFVRLKKSKAVGFLLILVVSVVDPGCLSLIRIFPHPGSRIPDPGSRIQANKRRSKNFYKSV